LDDSDSVTSVCESRQRTGMQDLRRVGKMKVSFKAIYGPKTYIVWGQCNNSCDIPNRSPIVYIVWKKFAVRFDVKLRSRRKTSKVGSFKTPIVRKKTPQVFWTCTCKTGSVPSMWKTLAKFP